MTLENELDNLKSLLESIEIDDGRKEALARRIEELEIKVSKNAEESIRRKESWESAKKGAARVIKKTLGHEFFPTLIFSLIVIGGLSMWGYWNTFTGEKKIVKTTIDQLSKSDVSAQNAREMLTDFLRGYSVLLSVPEESFPEKPAQSALYREWYYNTLRDALEKPYRLDEMRIVYVSPYESGRRHDDPTFDIKLVMTNGLGEILVENGFPLNIPTILRISPTRKHIVIANSELLVVYDQNLRLLNQSARLRGDPLRRDEINGNFARTSVLWLSDGSGFYLPSFGVLSPSLEKIAEEPQPGTLEKRNSPFKLVLENQSMFLEYGDLRVPITKTADQGRVLLADIAP